MSADLLATAVAAHGGLDRWNEYASVRANASVGGALWALKGRPGVLADVTVEARLHEQRITTREQVSYFGPDGLLRRHEYAVDVLGGGVGLNYASDYHSIGGIVVPTTRRVYAADGDRRKVADPLLVSIDLRDISFNI